MDLERWRLFRNRLQRRVGSAHCRLALLQLSLERRGIWTHVRGLHYI